MLLYILLNRINLTAPDSNVMKAMYLNVNGTICTTSIQILNGYQEYFDCLASVSGVIAMSMNVKAQTLYYAVWDNVTGAMDIFSYRLGNTNQKHLTTERAIPKGKLLL